MVEIIIYSTFILILVSIGVIFLLVGEGPVAGFCFFGCRHHRYFT